MDQETRDNVVEWAREINDPATLHGYPGERTIAEAILSLHDDVAAERQAGAGRLARLRAHIEAAAGEKHDAAIKDAFRIVDDESLVRLDPGAHRICAAFLVTLTELAEARANLAEIETGVRDLMASIEAKR
jgi:hypothetical protein